MRARIEVTMVVLMLRVLIACGGSACGGGGGGGGDGGVGNGVQAGVVKGVVVDSQARPLPGAKINVCNPLYFDSCMTGQTGSDGRYSFDLPPVNVWKAYGYLTKAYNGKSYCLELRSDSTDSFSSKDGAVRNFEWKLTGLRPDSKTAQNEFLSFYGAAAAVRSEEYNNPVDLQYVQASFVPQGPLVDGTAGQAFSASAGNWNWNEIGDIPLGRYTVTADYAPPGAAKSALLVGTVSGQYAVSVVLDFPPPGSCVRPEAKIYVAFP